MTYYCEASLYCDACGPHIEGADDVSHLSGESDTPQHCADCGELMFHALTDDGANYVAESLVEHVTDRRGTREVLAEWFDQWEHEVTEQLTGWIQSALARADYGQAEVLARTLVEFGTS